jgi:glycosyltransferase involved in cell wall biosynthesis
VKKQKQPPRPWVLYVHNSEHYWGCEAYRMIIPCDQNQHQGRVMDYAHWREVQKLFATHPESVMDYDVFVFPRSGFAEPRQATRLIDLGKKVVFEIDDDFTGKYREVVGDDDIKAKIWRLAHEANAVVCSTQYLANLMHETTGNPTYVLPNSVRMSDWQYVKKFKRLTIGLSGSSTHYADWVVLESVLPRIIETYPQVDLQIGGYLPPYLEDLMEKFPGRVIHQKWVPFQEHPGFAGRVHIGLCPIDPDDGFNHSKSGIKAVELMASKAAVVATDMRIYQEVMQHNRTGLLTPQESEAWYRNISVLIEDEYLRGRLAEKGQQHVARNFSIITNGDKWWNAFRTIAEV